MTAPPRLRTTTLEPEDVDARVVLIMNAVGRRLGTTAGWEAGPLDAAALLRIVAIIGKGMGADVEQLVECLRTHWEELPSRDRIRAASAEALARGRSEIKA